MPSRFEWIAVCAAAWTVLGAGCASVEVERVVAANDAILAKERARFEPPAERPPSAPAAFQYWTAVAYQAEAKRLRARAEFGQALGLARVAQKAAAEALHLLEAP